MSEARSKQLGLSQPEDWIDALREQARRDGYSISEWVYDVVCYNLDDDLVDRLADRPKPGRPKLKEKD